MNKSNLAFTILESTVILLITTVILGTALSLDRINKTFKKFQENIFLLNQDLKFTLDLAIKGSEFNLNGVTSTLCGVGIIISNQEKKYYQIGYATLSSSTVIDCNSIASNTPEVFNFTSYQPQVYISEGGNFSHSITNSLIRELKPIEEIKLATTTEIAFNTTSIIFTHPFGEPIVYYSSGTVDYRLNFDDQFQIIFINNNVRATTTIFKTGKIISK